MCVCVCVCVCDFFMAQHTTENQGLPTDCWSHVHVHLSAEVNYRPANLGMYIKLMMQFCQSNTIKIAKTFTF